jgi:hypothetical protein|tara:strand:- start:2707 stop:3309 length:603 start_codon:yes stop_codon:yes gene_type:complete
MDDLGFNDFDTPQNATATEDANLLCKFYTKLRPNKAKDVLDPKDADLPAKVEVVYYDIKVPGERDSRSGPVNESIKQRFPRHYAAYIQRKAPPVDGTPLNEWASITRTQVEELEFANIKTIEHLSNVSDVHAQNMRGLTALKQKAQAYLAQKEDTKFVDQLTDQLSVRDKTISALEERLALMEKRFVEGDTTKTTRKVKK